MPTCDVDFESTIQLELGRVKGEELDEFYLKSHSIYPPHLDGHKRDTLGLDDTTTPALPQILDSQLNGVMPHELPVIGFGIDERILPGFRYKVRYIGSRDYTFDGEARTLLSIGLGYGRRLTFLGDSLNKNDCYFWSDSHPDGFAFSIDAVQEGDVFQIYDVSSKPVGEAIVQRICDHQVDEGTICEGDAVVKQVRVKFECSVTYFHPMHSLVDVLNSEDIEVLEGLAEVAKMKKEKTASVRCINNLTLGRIGQCSFHKDP